MQIQSSLHETLSGEKEILPGFIAFLVKFWFKIF